MYQRIFIRHLTTDKNVAGYDASAELQRRVRSRRNALLPVNEEGHREGRLLRESFASYLLSRGISGPVVFVHSDLERTRTTASCLLESVGRHMDRFDICLTKGSRRVRDIDHGRANDLPYAVVRERFPDYARDIDSRGYLDARPPGGESHRDALPRIRRFLKSLESYRCHVVVVTHLSTLVLIRSVLERLPDEAVLDMLSRSYPPNASITRYEYDEAKRNHALLEEGVMPWSRERASHVIAHAYGAV